MEVAKAVDIVRTAGYKTELNLVGSAYGPSLKKLNNVLRRIDPNGDVVNYHGRIPYNHLPSFYRDADMFVFASSCENMPNILLEAMAAGLPIISSNRGPMSEILGDTGIYCDPEKPESIAHGILSYIEDPVTMKDSGNRAFERAQQFSWQRCADEPFDFIGKFVSLGKIK